MYEKIDYPSMTLHDNVNTPMPIKEGQNAKVLFPNNSIRTFKISHNPDHAAPESGIISLHSPLGQALIGRTVGDEVQYKVGDRVLKVKILGVE